MIKNQNLQSQTENDKTAGVEYPNEEDSEERETNKTCNSQLYDEFEEDINLLNSKQREVFNVVYKWARHDEMYDEFNAEPVRIFLLKENLIW